MKNKIELKLLLHDLKSLNSELSNKKKKLEYINMFFLDEIKIKKNISDIDTTEKITNNINIEHNQENNVEDTTNNITKNIDIKHDIIDDNTKKIFREIVLQTHPDRLQNNENKLKYIELYNQAVLAKDKNNIALLLIIADELNIDYDSYISNDEILGIKDNINIIRSQILHIEQLNVWKWYHTDNEKLRNILLSNYLKFSK